MEWPRRLVMLPGPTNVPDRIMRAMLKPITNHRGETYRALHKTLIEKTKKVFETTGDAVILAASGTGAVEASVTNIVKPGDNIIVTVFGEFGERLAGLVEGAGGHVTKVEAPYGDAPSVGEVAEAFERVKNAKALYVVTNETSTGVAFRHLKEAGEIAARHGAFYILDAVSNFGGDYMPVDALGIDVLATASQKCLAAPPGVGIVTVSPRAKKYMVENPIKLLYFNLARYFTYYERNTETPFTPALPLCYALDEAYDMVLEEGMQSRIERHRICASAFYSALEAMGIESFAKREVRSNTVIPAKYPEGAEDRAFRRLLLEEYRVEIAGGFGDFRGKLFRIGCMGEVRDYHVLTTVSALASAFIQQGVKVDPTAGLSAAMDKLKAL